MQARTHSLIYLSLLHRGWGGETFEGKSMGGSEWGGAGERLAKGACMQV